MPDKRRRRWISVSVDIAYDRIVERFGLEGLAVWVCYLAACKKSPVPGTFIYHSEAEGLLFLGLAAHPPNFTLEEFFTFTGRGKQTRRTRRGREMDVKCTRWEEWQNVKKTPAHSPQIPPKSGRDTATDSDRDKDPDNDRVNGQHSALAEAVAARLQVLGQIDLRRVARVVADFPDRDHLGEAASMADWALAKGHEWKDVNRAYLNWLKRAKPRVASGETSYPELDPETV